MKTAVTHLRSTHYNLTTCPICGQKFSSTGALRRHILYSHIADTDKEVIKKRCAVLIALAPTNRLRTLESECEEYLIDMD